MVHLANYRIGRSYWFIVPELGKTFCKVLNKGYKKIELSAIVEGGFQELGWVSSENLSLPKSEKVAPLTKKIKINFNAKPASKPVAEYDANKDKVILLSKKENQPKIRQSDTEVLGIAKTIKPVTTNDLPVVVKEVELVSQKENLNKKLDSENITDHQYALRCTMRDLRFMLRHHGIVCDKNELIAVTLGKINANLKNKGKG
jgi:hypothetical protein